MAPRLPVCGSAQSRVPHARGPGLPPSRNRPHAPEGRRGPGRLAVGSRDMGASRRGAARFSSAPAGSGASGAAGGGCSAVWGPPRRHVGATATPGCHSSRKPGQVSRFKLTPSSESPLRWGRPHRGRSHSSCNPCPPRGTWSRRRPPGRRGRPCREAPASDTHVRPRADPPRPSAASPFPDERPGCLSFMYISRTPQLLVAVAAFRKPLSVPGCRCREQSLAPSRVTVTAATWLAPPVGDSGRAGVFYADDVVAPHEDGPVCPSATRLFLLPLSSCRAGVDAKRLLALS